MVVSQSVNMVKDSIFVPPPHVPRQSEYVNMEGQDIDVRDCGGSSICEHNRRRSVCRECGGGEICEHGKVRDSLQRMWRQSDL